MDGCRQSPLTSHRIRVRGAVQGVGFRPTVYGVAQSMNASGWVLNDSEGVLIHLDNVDSEAFLQMLTENKPPLARIDDIQVEATTRSHAHGFVIKESIERASADTCVSADAATCDACLDDICTPDNPRYQYPFTNCTHCGPRYSITRKVPYDRANTSMATFQMCDTCQSEYDAPLDRRFHAQPNACPECGPQLSHSIEEIVEVLQSGGTVALKGLGGYQLLADARCEAAVAKLRAIKKRDAKPFAVMVAGRAGAYALAHLSDAELAALQSHQRPIVVAKAREAADLAPSLTLGLGTVGLMLPTTGLHYLLFHQACGSPSGIEWRNKYEDLALVATSANLAGDPLIIDDEIAVAEFGSVADLVVTHNRPILIPVDDSVVRVIDGSPMFLRRARGYAPDPVALEMNAPPVLALGAELKNTICVTRGKEAFLSQHIGGQETLKSQQHQLEVVQHLLDTLNVSPRLIVTDLHPNMNTRTLSRLADSPVLRVQHHHAHIASVLAEHGVQAPTLGLALDGFGLGADGKASWGGELLRVDGANMEHVSHLLALPAAGGDVASREPWRMAVAAVKAAGLEVPDHLQQHQGFELVSAMLDRDFNCAPTSSAGRLFDGVSSLCNLQHVNRFEGEAAMRLEDLAIAAEVLPESWEILQDGSLSMLPLMQHLTYAPAQQAANWFHGSFAAALVDWVRHHALQQGSPQKIALSGGCFQNKLFTEAIVSGLRGAGFEPLLNKNVPPNDGGLALGQAWVAAHYLQAEGD